MEKKNGAVDVSCFLLVEGSGDSEADYGPVIAMHDDGHDDEDDAESCCGRVREIQMLDDYDEEVLECDDPQEVNRFDKMNWRNCNIWCMDAAEEMRIDATEEGEEEAVFGINRSRDVNHDGVEDRLFWEICMAVGYP